MIWIILASVLYVYVGGFTARVWEATKFFEIFGVALLWPLFLIALFGYNRAHAIMERKVGKDK